MAFRLDISERKKGTYLKIEKKYWDKDVFGKYKSVQCGS